MEWLTSSWYLPSQNKHSPHQLSSLQLITLQSCLKQIQNMIQNIYFSFKLIWNNYNRTNSEMFNERVVYSESFLGIIQTLSHNCFWLNYISIPYHKLFELILIKSNELKDVWSAGWDSQLVSPMFTYTKDSESFLKYVLNHLHSNSLGMILFLFTPLRMILMSSSAGNAII